MMLSELKIRIEKGLEEIFRMLNASDRIVEACRYSTLGGGKRLRALLTATLALELGAELDAAVSVSLAPELLHAASLVHDDLPALDNDDLRRGQPSCHRAFGEATAVLAGDFLVPLAFKVASEAPLPAEQRCRILRSLSTGFMSVLDGQQRDLDKPPISELVAVHRLKTGGLFRAVAEVAAAAAGRDQHHIERAGSMGELFGLAFQLIDDHSDGDGFATDPGFIDLLRDTVRSVTEEFDLLIRPMRRDQSGAWRLIDETFSPMRSMIGDAAVDPAAQAF